MSNYTALHVHSDLSLLDSCTKFEDYVKLAVQYGQTAIASTEHGNIYNWTEKKAICDQYGIKYIHGCEVYLTESLFHKRLSKTGNYIEEYKIRDNYHTILLAKNEDGIKELNRIVGKATEQDHVYYKPRVTFDEFFGISDNIIKLSACLQSPLNKLENRIEALESDIEEYRTILKSETDSVKQGLYSELLEERKRELEYVIHSIGRLLNKYDYYEIQYHNVPEQIDYNRKLYELSKKYNKPLVACTDTHSLNQYKSECRLVLQKAKTGAIFGQKKDNKEADFTSSENDFDLSYKSYDELLRAFEEQNSLPMEVVLQAIENTNVIANSVEDFKLDTSIKYPKMYENDDDELETRVWHLLDKKVKAGIVPQSEEAKFKENLTEELRVFKKLGMSGFMLSMSDICSWAKENDHPLGIARGSCFTKDALVQCIDTLRTIDTIKIGDMVLSHDGKFHEVIATQKYDVDEPTIEIDYYGCGSLTKKYKMECTLDHKFLVNRDGENIFVEADKIKKTDFLCAPIPKNNHPKKEVEIIDLNDYNVFGFDYDDEYIYEIQPTNKPFDYSSHWMENNIPGINRTIINKITNGHIPNKELLGRIMNSVPFDTVENYIAYSKKRAKTIRKIKRFIPMDYLTNLFIGMIYGDGWTIRKYGVGIAVNSKEKSGLNKYAFLKMAERLNADVCFNQSKRKDLLQIFINSSVLNNWVRTEFFESKKGRAKLFNTKLLDQSNDNLKWLYLGLLKTDGSTKNGKKCFDNTSLSLVSAFRILSGYTQNEVLAMDVRLEHDDNRGYHNRESYKARVALTPSKYKKDSDFYYLKIENITRHPKHRETVYDITVKDSHSFVVNNIAVHNCGGSCVAYITDIIDLDPVKWNTNFARFCNENRHEVGDIDIDAGDEDRPYIYDYIIKRFGEDKTARVLALGTSSEKATIENICRAFEIPLDEVDRIKKEWDIDQEKCRKKHKDIFYYFDGVLGSYVSQSIHAAGIVASPITLYDNYGVFRNSDGLQIICLDMDCVHDVGLVKYDILGLRQIPIIKETCKYVGIPYPKSYQIDWEDEKVWEDIKTTPIALFQFEEDYSFRSLCNYGASSIDDMTVVTAAIRPSGASYREDLFAHKPHKNPSELIDNLLSDTNGYLCIEGNQLVNTKNGLKPIKDVVAGDYVLTRKGWREVTRSQKTGTKKTVKVNYGGRSIQLTPDHQILTDYGWKEAGTLAPGDVVAYRVNYDDCAESEYSKLCRVLGWVIGDGDLSYRPAIQMVSRDLDVVNAFKAEVESVYNDCTVSVYSRASRVNKIPLYQGYTKYKYNKLDKKKIVDDFETIGLMGKVATNKFIPDFLFVESQENIKKFLGAYTDTDSCINSAGAPITSYKTASKPLAYGLQELIRKIGYFAYIEPLKYNTGSIYYNIVVNEAASYLNFLYNYSIKIRKTYPDGISPDRQMNPRNAIHKDVMNNFIPRNKWKYMSKNGYNPYSKAKYASVYNVDKIVNVLDVEVPDEFTNKNIKWIKIQSIEDADVVDVYDITVDGEHEFTCQGIIVHNCYQEQIISFLQQICGLSGSEADDVRRGIARKKVDVLQAHMSQILDGYCEKSDKPRDIAEKEAEEFIQIIEDASSYMFGRNHAIAYSMIGYLIGYLRYYYPLEFITAFFNYSPTESDISNGMQLAKLKGIKIKPPKFRYSKAKYFMDKETNSIYKGISSIKYMSDDVANGLYNLRDNHYDTFIDLLKDIKEKTVINARQLEILIKLDFFSEFGNARELLALNDWFVFFKHGAMKTIKKDKIKDEILTKIVARNSTETATQFKIVNMDNILRDVELMQRSYDIKDFGYRDKILQQIEYYGYIDINEESQNIEDKKKLIVLKVTPMKAKTGRNAGKVWCYIVDTQSIGSGKHGTWTILEDVFRSNPVKQYDIIKAELFSPKVYNGRKYWYLNKYSQIY